jgi:hypothetical protein
MQGVMCRAQEGAPCSGACAAIRVTLDRAHWLRVLSVERMCKRVIVLSCLCVQRTATMSSLARDFCNIRGARPRAAPRLAATLT